MGEYDNFQFNPVYIPWIVKTWEHQQSCILIDKGNPMCVP